MSLRAHITLVTARLGPIKAREVSSGTGCSRVPGSITSIKFQPSVLHPGKLVVPCEMLHMMTIKE